LDGAAQGVLVLRRPEKNISLICFPEFIDNRLGDANWVFDNGRHNSIPWFLVPETKNDVFWLLKKLKFRE
jgi:hypothetical protein